MGRRAAPETIPEANGSTERPNGESKGEICAQPTTAQKVASGGATMEVAPEPFGREAKHFTEMRTLNRDVSFRCL